MHAISTYRFFKGELGGRSKVSGAFLSFLRLFWVGCPSSQREQKRMGTFRPKKERGGRRKKEMYCKGKRDPSCLRRRNWKFLFFGWVALLSSLSLSDLEGVVYGAVDPVVRRHHHHPVPPKVLQHGNHRFGDLK